jgi:sugar phosphate isomerase/epimerase
MPLLSPDRIALQLYTLRADAQRDLVGVLKTAGGIGFRAVEFAGLHGVEPALVRGALNGLEMEAAAAHVPLARWTDEPDAALAELDAIGCPTAVVPWVGPERRGNRDEALRLAGELNAIGRRCADAGFAFAYHHHDFEFAPLPDAEGDARTMFDVIVAETDPTLVGLELDLYWAAVAGVDPAGLLARMAGRVPLVHLKDMGAEPNERGIPADKPVGSGTLDWSGLVPAATAAGARWYVVEQDNPNPADPAGDAAAAFRFLTA